MGDVFLGRTRLDEPTMCPKADSPRGGRGTKSLGSVRAGGKGHGEFDPSHTIEIFDYGHTDDGTFYYVMEYLPGLGLDQLLAEYGPLPPGTVIFLLRQVCSALARSSCGPGLIHRDLKPGNLYISERGGLCDFVKVLDFGLVKRTQEPNGATAHGRPRRKWHTTLHGSRTGTRLPKVDARSDLYALGAIAYHALRSATVSGGQSHGRDDRTRPRGDSPFVFPPHRHPG